MHRRLLGLVTTLLYIATIVGANYAVKHFGTVPVFGYQAPYAVAFVSAALIFRDGVQRWLGIPAALAAMVLGLVLSVVTGAGDVALASSLGFVASELADLASFSYLSGKGLWYEGVAIGAAVGVVLDSVIFLSVAPQIVPPVLVRGHVVFAGLSNSALLPGQLIGKAISVAAALVVLTPPRVRQARAKAALRAAAVAA